jgi:hypothetical protein
MKNKNNKKSSAQDFLKQICVVATLIYVATGTIALTSAQPSDGNVLPLGDASEFGESIVGDPGGSTVAESLANLVGGFTSTDSGLIGRFRLLLAAIAIAMTIYSALKMLLAQGEESKVTNAKKGIYFGILGLLVVSLAGEVTKILSVNKQTAEFIFVDKTGQSLACSYANTILGGGGSSTGAEMLCRVNFFNATVKLVITLIKYIIGSIAVYETVTNGYRMMTLGSESSSLEREKKNFLFGAIGLLTIIFSESVIGKVFYRINFKAPYSQLTGLQPAVNIDEGIRQIVAIANVAISILGPALILIFIASIVYYMVSAGEEEKQKQAGRALTFAAIGILVIYGAFGIISTIISGQFG